MVHRTYIVTVLVAVSLTSLPLAGLLACHCPSDCDACAKVKEVPSARESEAYEIMASSRAHDCCADPARTTEPVHSACSLDLLDSTVCLCKADTLYFIHHPRDTWNLGTAGGDGEPGVTPQSTGCFCFRHPRGFCIRFIPSGSNLPPSSSLRFPVLMLFQGSVCCAVN